MCGNMKEHRINTKKKKTSKKKVHGEKSHKLYLFTLVAAGMLRRMGNESTET